MSKRHSLPIIALIILVLIACDGTSSATGKAAPCGREGDTKEYAGQNWECTQQGWQVDQK